MIHEDFDVQVSTVVAVHGESTRLCKSVNDGRMSMVSAASLHAAEAEVAHGLQRIAVQYDLINGTVIVVESSQRSNCAIYHRTVEPGGGAGRDSISENLDLLLHLCSVLLKGF